MRRAGRRGFDPLTEGGCAKAPSALDAQRAQAKHDLAVVYYEPGGRCASDMVTCDTLEAAPSMPVAGAADYARIHAGVPARVVGYGPSTITQLQGNVAKMGECRFGDVRIGPSASSPTSIHVVPEKAMPVPGDSGGPLLLRSAPTDVVFGVFSRFNISPRDTHGVYTSLEAPENAQFVAGALAKSFSQVPCTTPTAPKTICGDFFEE